MPVFCAMLLSFAVTLLLAPILIHWGLEVYAAVYHADLNHWTRPYRTVVHGSLLTFLGAVLVWVTSLLLIWNMV